MTHLTPEDREHIRELIDEHNADKLRVLEWVRVRQLTLPHGPFSKPHIYRLLGQGRLRGKRVDKIVLVCLKSVRALIDEAEEWRK